MTKKNYVCKNKESIQEIIGWTTPKLHQASECYVSFKVFDPCYGKLRLKKIMLGHIKGKRNQRVYGEALIKRITQKLLEGWNPWIEESNQEEYALFADVCGKYRAYIAKMVKEGGLKPGTRRNYEGKLDFLQKWLNGDEHITYIYQFNKTHAYLLYRKMWKEGLLTALLSIVLSVPSLIAIVETFNPSLFGSMPLHWRCV